MTDRFHSLQVVLETDTREDDAQALIAAITCLRGVIGVTGMVADPHSALAQLRVRRELREKLYKVLNDHPL